MSDTNGNGRAFRSFCDWSLRALIAAVLGAAFALGAAAYAKANEVAIAQAGTARDIEYIRKALERIERRIDQSH